MPGTKRPGGVDDPSLRQIREILEAYRLQHPGSQVDAFRRNASIIYVRIVDPGVDHLDDVDRFDLGWHLFDPLPDEVVTQIGFLLLLTPDELEDSGANHEFEYWHARKLRAVGA